MDYQYYERKINDVIIKCPIEAGIEILVYNLLDYILETERLDGVSLVDINRLWKNRDERLTTSAGVPDIAVLSDDFRYMSDAGRVYGFVEVKATNKALSETEQILGQREKTNHYIYTNGLCWKYYHNKKAEPEWDITLSISKVKSSDEEKEVSIDKSKFSELLCKLKNIEWAKNELNR